MRLLERDFGRAPEGQWAHANHYLLDALDRGEHHRFVVWPGDDPVAVLYCGSTGTLMPAGDAAAAAAFAETSEQTGWRILLGDLPITEGILNYPVKALFRRRVSAREQRFMTATRASLPPGGRPPGFRLAVPSDVERLTDFACLLHVEDRMGPPISRSGRASVRARMVESVAQGATWVMERDGAAVAKIDLSLRSRRRGAQLAGVFVDPRWRNRGIGAAVVRALARELLDDGLPVVSLHVRADNAPGIAAYRTAGFRDQRCWLLALR
ncbi:MAG: GNAT family N-acetyltransferase [Egibacteraceae bacterium]